VSRQRGGRISVYSEVGRRGIPAARSFAAWVDAALGARNGMRQVNIALVGPRKGRQLNRQFRGKDYATNVLSFPYVPAPGEKSPLLGDLVLCPPVMAREAVEQRKPLRHHYAHLTIHGVLHLLGYDHGTDAGAARMEKLERRLLAAFGIPDPYE